MDAAKKRAVAQNVDYDAFKNMVAAAHLRPLHAPNVMAHGGSWGGEMCLPHIFVNGWVWMRAANRSHHSSQCLTAVVSISFLGSSPLLPGIEFGSHIVIGVSQNHFGEIMCHCTALRLI